MEMAPDLLALLACPVCKQELVYDPAASTLTCPACRLRYRVADGIPNLLVDEAERF